MVYMLACVKSAWAMAPLRLRRYNQTSDPGTLAMFGSPMHAGFAGVWAQLWPAVKASLNYAFPTARQQDAKANAVFVTGHR